MYAMNPGISLHVPVPQKHQECDPCENNIKLNSQVDKWAFDSVIYKKHKMSN